MAVPTDDDKDPITLGTELWDLIVRYAKQETLDPIKALGRYLKWGMAGAVLLTVGVPMLLLGALRALELETSPHWGGSWSWAPYAIVVGACGVMAFLLVRGIGADKRRAERRRAGLTKREG